MILSTKILLSLFTTLTAFALAYGPYNASKTVPNATIPDLYAVYPDWPITVPAPSTTVLPAANTAAGVTARALDAGLPATEIDTALQVAYRESRYNPAAYNPTDANGGSYGYYQINGFWCRPNKYWPQGWLQTQRIVTTCTDLYDPATNSRAMVAIWLNSGWKPWATNG